MKGQIIIDLGCGDVGWRLLQEYHNLGVRKYIGVDVSANKIRESRGLLKEGLGYFRDEGRKETDKDGKPINYNFWEEMSTNFINADPVDFLKEFKPNSVIIVSSFLMSDEIIKDYNDYFYELLNQMLRVAKAMVHLDDNALRNRYNHCVNSDGIDDIYLTGMPLKLRDILKSFSQEQIADQAHIYRRNSP